jgi:hypothetical protein
LQTSSNNGKNREKKTNKGRIPLRDYRNEIKDPIIASANISPVEFKRKRGNQYPDYSHDEADGVIIAIAGEIFGRKIKKLEVFWLVYSCKTYEQTKHELPKNVDGDNPDFLDIETVRKYARETKKAVKDFIRENVDKKEEIKSLIKKEYERRKDT